MPPPPSERLLLSARIAAVAAVIAMGITAQQLGLLHLLGEPARLRQMILDLGPWGYAAFVGSYAALQPFGVPGTVFIWVAPLVWPWPIAFVLSMTGTMAASVVGFTFARFVARDFLAARIPARFRRYDEALGRRAFTTVFLLRLVLWMPPLLHAFFGVSRVSFATHFWGSLLGYIVPLLAVSYFGERLLVAALAAPAWALWVTGIVVALGIAAWFAWRRRARAEVTVLLVVMERACCDAA